MISRLVRWLARNRRKVARHKKLDDQLNKTDTAGNGKITSQQMPKFFEAHEIFGKFGLVCVNSGNIRPKFGHVKTSVSTLFHYFQFFFSTKF